MTPDSSSSPDLQNDVVETHLTTSPSFPFDILTPTDPISFHNFEPLDNDAVFPSNSLNLGHNQVSFIMDLIHQRIEHPQTQNTQFSQPPLDLDLHLGFPINNNAVLDFSGGLTRAIAGSDGDWDIDFESEFAAPVVELDVDDEFDPVDEYRIVSGSDNDDLMIPLRDSLMLNESTENFEWEEIGRIANDEEALDMFLFEGDAFVPVLSQEEEERAGEVLDELWENLMDREFYLEDSMIDRELVSFEDQIVGRLFEDDNAGIGKPPAGEKEVERLVVVVVREGDVEMGNVICVVCKDDMSVGEEVREMPCGHRYHGDCILPWLRIRNTCPVCRYELPTDDPDYERTRARRVGPVN